MRKYSVYKIHSISSNLSDDLWEKAILLNDFSCPWLNETPEETHFRALYDDRYLYLRYDVIDSNINIYCLNDTKMDVTQSDRVEIFFRENKALNPYYGLEIDPNGKVLDYLATFYREFDYTWHWPKGHLFTKGNINTNGYRVDVKISLESLKMFNLIQNNRLEVGIYRADCFALPTKKIKDAEIKWVSWVNPKTKIPDFHVPSSFGILELKK